MNVLPSTSSMCAPEARRMNSGEAPTDLNARTGLSTPPGRMRHARWKRRVDLFVRIFNDDWALLDTRVLWLGFLLLSDCTCVDAARRGLSANSPLGCSANSTRHGSRLRARAGARSRPPARGWLRGQQSATQD